MLPYFKQLRKFLDMEDLGSFWGRADKNIGADLYEYYIRELPILLKECRRDRQKNKK